MKWLTLEQWREYDNAKNCLICAKPFKSVDKKVWDPQSFDRLIKRSSSWITTSIQRKGKFHTLCTTSKVYCFYVMTIFTFASFETHSGSYFYDFFFLIFIAIFFFFFFFSFYEFCKFFFTEFFFFFFSAIFFLITSCYFLN